MESLKKNARKLGGLVLENQVIHGYKNGPRFIIKKAYLTDGVLTAGKRYTIILIPCEGGGDNDE
jgi:hypothetical protein